MRRLGVREHVDWVGPRGHARTHYCDNQSGELVCLVCLGEGHEKRAPIEVAGLLVHEAVHVWQQYCAAIGETEPGAEQEAYGIQCIAQELMSEYARRTAP